ncbi:hypothetical protein DPMN_049484 [Dreissena polymorpha]|uniref:Uncharacterized protein n=1 Tax=Dreissena polymorpha TaxID=45954 RepID=A0A9D4CEF6_DREPO|nr:hypothetical protein DPMN_049484 [Dreissena polymorpha]
MIVAETSAADLHALKLRTREVTPAYISINTKAMSRLTKIQQTVRPKPAPRAMQPCSVEQHNTTEARQSREILIDPLPPSAHLLVNSSPVRNLSVIEQPDSHNLQDTSQHDLYVAKQLDGFQQQNRRRGRFSTVARKHHKSYVIKGIGLDRDLEGLEDFLTNDIRITYRSMKFLYYISRRLQSCSNCSGKRAG